MAAENISYPIFKGLQRPLEFMGLRGRYIGWAAGTVGATLLVFIILFTTLGFVVGLIGAVVILSAGAGFIGIKQKRGLHSKKAPHGIFIYAFLKGL